LIPFISRPAIFKAISCLTLPIHLAYFPPSLRRRF
jgi:hypothetical protein